MGRQIDLEPGTTEVTVEDPNRTAVERRDLSDDRQSESTPPGIPISRGIESDEPLEDVLSLGRIDPDPVVVDAQDRAPAHLLERETDDAARVSSRVVGEVPDEPLELLARLR